MIKRNQKLAFMDVGAETAEYSRMTGFTELTVSKNPKEYSRKYVDEDTERSTVVSYAPSVSYKLDLENGNSVHEIFKKIADRELVGDDAVRSVVIVDISNPNQSGACPAVCRNFAVIPGREGDDTDMYTMSGDMKASGEKVFGTAVTTDGWQTITFTAEA